MYKNTPVHYIAKYAVDFMFYSGILCTLVAPFIAKYVGYDQSDSVIFAIMLFLSGVCAVFVMFNLKQMFSTLLGGNPFVMKNVCSLRRIAVACAVISAIYIVKCFLLFTFSTLVIVIVFSIGTLFCLTLKDIFKQAISLKEENDLTI